MKRSIGIVHGMCAVGIGFILRWLYPWIYRQWFSALPEAEVPVYMIGILLYMIVITVLIVLARRDNKTHAPTAAVTHATHIQYALYFLLFGVLMLFIQYDFFSTLNTIPTQLAQIGIVYHTMIPTQLVFPFVLCLTTLLYLCFGPHIHKSWRLPITVVCILLICVSTLYVGQLAPYDSTHFVGPIHDALLGVPPLTSPSWYGFLSIAFLSLFFHGIPLTLINLYIVIACLETFGFIALFFFLLWFMEDFRWAILTVSLGILFHFLVQYGDRNYYLQATSIRFGLWLPIVIAMLWETRAQKKRFRIWASIAVLTSVSLAFFWTTDVGLYVLAAYCCTLWVLHLSGHIGESIGRWIRHVLPVGLYIVAAFVGITVYYLVEFHTSPNWANYWQFAWGYTSISMFALPMPFSIFPWALLAIPVITVGRILEYPQKNPVIIFLAFFSIFQFTYMTGDSHLNSLHTINLPVIVCAIWLIREYLEWAKKQSNFVAICACFLITSVSVIPLFLWGRQGIQNLRSGNIITTLQTIRHPTVTEQSLFGYTAYAVKNRYASVLTSGNFAIISPWDTWYITLWGTTNKLGSNCLLCYWTPKMAAPLKQNMAKLRVRYLFVDEDRVGYEGRVSWIFDKIIQSKYHYIEQIGNLQIYERI